jgi:hypothetical protein
MATGGESTRNPLRDHQSMSVLRSVEPVWTVVCVCLEEGPPMLREAAGALEKSKNEEWPFAGVSGSAFGTWSVTRNSHILYII